MTHLWRFAYQWTDEPAQAVQEMLRTGELSVALTPDDPMGHVALARGCVFSGQFERAIVANERAIELNPSFAWAYAGLGYALALMDRPDDGVGMLEKAIRLSPHDPLMHLFLHILGVAHFVAGRYEEAVTCAKRSLESRRDDPLPYRLLAASYGHLGRTEDARAALGAMYRLAAVPVENLRLFAPAAVLERFLDGLRKAGWKE